MASTRARWAEGVPDLVGDLTQVPNYMNVAQVSAATSLSPNTIEDALSRPPITNPGNALGPLSRPARRVGNTPLWSREQVDEAVRRQRATGHRHLGGGDRPLPLVDADDADRSGYVSTEEIAEMAHMRTQGELRPVHEQTVRRWARDNGDFPPAVALRARSQGHPGVPIVVYDGEKVLEFLRNRGGVHVVPHTERLKARLRELEQEDAERTDAPVGRQTA